MAHLDLLQETWDDEFTDPATLRAGVKRLRVNGLRRPKRLAQLGGDSWATKGGAKRWPPRISTPLTNRRVTAAGERQFFDGSAISVTRAVPLNYAFKGPQAARYGASFNRLSKCMVPIAFDCSWRPFVSACEHHQT